MNPSLSYIDLAIIIFYLFGIVFIGLWVVRKDKSSASSYFLAGRNLNWILIGSALFASNISTIHLVGLAASGFSDGLVWGNFEWMAAFILIVLGLVFAPFYFKNKISTLPEFLEKRYDRKARVILAIMGLIGALFLHIGISLYAGAVVFKNFLGIDVYVSILIISGITALYTVLGGLKSVVITETIQTVILIAGSLIITGIAVYSLPDVGINSWSDLVAASKPDQWSMVQGSDSPTGLTWYSILLGYPVLGIWYWCADQTIVQRVLAAKTLEDAQKGPVFAGFIKVLPVMIMVAPGILAYVLFKDIINDPNDALPTLITQLLPVGLKGIMAAALLSALMSTIAAALNSSATLVAFDIVKVIKPETSDKQQVRIGKITAALVMVLAILWSPLIASFNSIFEAIMNCLSVLSPPIAAVFFWGVFSARVNAKGAFYTMIIGFVLGIIVFSLDFPFFTEERVFTEMLGIPFMMQTWWLFVICSVVLFFVSSFSAKPELEKTANLTILNPATFLFKDKVTGIGDVRILSLLLIIIMIILYFIFH